MGQNYAIAIGINEYYNQRSLKYAERDASALRDYCLNEARFSTVYYFSENSPSIVTDYGPPLRTDPTYGNIQNFLDRRFTKPFLHAGDNLWFFFAGHGKRQSGRDYLMLKDSNPHNLERTAVSIRDLTAQLKQSGADNVVLMLDACRNEDDRSVEGIGQEKPKGVITLFSCSPNQVSYEIDALQQGSFTYSLLNALRIEGEGNCATVERLYQHLYYGVPSINRQYGKSIQQNPYLIVDPPTKLHFILLPHQATLSDVLALKNDALEAEAQQDFSFAEKLWIRVLASSPADAQAIEAIKRLATVSVSSPLINSEPRTQSLRSVSQKTSGTSQNEPIGSRGNNSVEPISHKSVPKSSESQQAFSQEHATFPIFDFIFQVLSLKRNRRQLGRVLTVFAGLIGIRVMSNFLWSKNDKVRVIQPVGVKVYTEPNSRSSHLMTIPYDTILQITAIDNASGWIKVKLPKSRLEGWIQEINVERLHSQDSEAHHLN